MGFLDVGPLELIVVFAVALLVFGPNRLPEVIGQVGRWVRNIRRITDEVTREVTRELNIDDANRTSYSYSAPMPPPPTYYPPVEVAPAPQIETAAEPAVEAPAEPTPAVDNRSVTPAFGGHYGMEGELASLADDEPVVTPARAAEVDGPVEFEPSTNGSGAADEPTLNGTAPHIVESSTAAERP
jgi:Tat protein translocase TatB subunit